MSCGSDSCQFGSYQKKFAIVEVAKFAISNQATIATMRGGGLTYAEKIVKDSNETGYRLELGGGIEEDLTSFEGLSCRWSPIKAQRGEIMNLLVVARDLGKSQETYRRIIGKIERILDEEESHPVSPTKVGGIEYRSLLQEMRMHSIGTSPWQQIKILGQILFEVAVMQIFMWTGAKTKTFLAERNIREMGENTNFQKFDDMIRMVRDCSAIQKENLIAMLESERRTGEIAYGAHLSNEALLTCLVLQLDNHIYFVDGSGGGYFLSGKQLK